MTCIHCEQPIVKLFDGSWTHDSGDGESWSSCRCECGACRAYGYGGQPAYELVAQNQLGTECCDGEEATPPTYYRNDPADGVKTYV